MERPVKDPLIGTTLDDKFRLIERTGQGATSSVYKAEELSTSNFVAIKVLHAHLCENESLVARFQREALAAAILVHPNIVAVRSFGIADSGTPYLVMDFADGVSLQQKLSIDGWLPASHALPLFIQICAALNVAHQAGIVHRDLKPGNIMLIKQADGTTLVKILDFGCAMVVPLLGDTVLKVTQTGEMLGSLLYMSPEQCLDQDVDVRSDIYALACVLYETLTGKPPLSARTAFETMNKQISEMPDHLDRVRPDLNFPPSLEKVIFKCMAKAPAKRYQTVNELMDDLTQISHGKSLVHHIEVVHDKKHPIKSKKRKAIKKKLKHFWDVYWPYVCLFFTFLSLKFYPVLILLNALVFGTLLVKAIIDEGKAPAIEELDIPELGEIESEQESAEKQALKHVLTKVAPLAKIEIFVHAAKKSFTYSSGDALILMTVSLDTLNLQEIIVRPVFQKSFYWDTLCDESLKAKESGESFVIPAYITKSTDNNWNVVVIKANQATIIEVVSENTSPAQDESNLEELNFEA